MIAMKTFLTLSIHHGNHIFPQRKAGSGTMRERKLRHDDISDHFILISTLAQVGCTVVVSVELTIMEEN